MREQFEKLPDIHERLHTVIFNEQFNDYHAAMINSGLSVYYVRGAWRAWQEQQKKIDEKDYDLTEVGMIINDDGLMYEAMIERIKELLK